MRFAGPGVAEQHDRFAGIHVTPTCQLSEESEGDAGDGINIEVRQSFPSRKLGVVDTSGAASAGAFVDLGGEDFGEITQVCLAFPSGDLGEADLFGAHGGQMQFACRGTEGSLGGRIGGERGGAHDGLPVSRSS